MGKFKRIPMKDIKTMQKILDDLPDKNLGKTREEAAELLNAHILKALEKGYTVKGTGGHHGPGQRGHSRARHPGKGASPKGDAAKA
ncbi:MAG: hypothetical protein ACLSAH_23595 [Bilophila wadsworthia]